MSESTAQTGRIARRAVMIAALLGASGVIMGAFGAHAVQDRIEPELFKVYQTGALYHMLHAVALLAVSVWLRWAPRRRLLHAAAIFFTLGVIIFSGSLYVLALTGIRWLGAITPVGGTLLIIAWLLTAASAWKR